MADRAAAHPWISLLRSRWNDFARWWLAGLHDTLPLAWNRWLVAPAGPALVIERTDRGYLCRAMAGAERQGPHTLAQSGKDALAAYLADTGLRRDEVTVGLLMDRSSFLTRDIDVPDMAMSALPRLLDQDILHRTPFGLSDVMHGTTATGAPGPRRGVAHLRHWIVRRDIVEAALQAMGLGPEGVDTLFARDDENRDVPVIGLGPSPARDRPRAKRALTLAAGMACLGTVVALVAVDQAQDGEADRLAAASADIKARAHGANGVMDAVGLLTIKADIGMAAILNELSKVMPDDTFLTELRIADGRVEAVGFSGDAARLVRLVDGSPVFKAAALAGAIEPNAAESKEHFAIKAELRTGQMLRLRAAAGRPHPALQEDSRS